MESGEDFWLRYYDGSSWQTVATLASGSEFNNDVFYSVTVPILGSAFDMSNNAKFRFQCDASANADKIYIDAVTVTGISGNSLINNEVKIIRLQNTSSLSQYADIDEPSLSPNPAQESIALKIAFDYQQEVNLTILDILGRVVSAETIGVDEGVNEHRINISDFRAGTYFMKLVDSDGDQTVKKFIKLQ